MFQKRLLTRSCVCPAQRPCSGDLRFAPQPDGTRLEVWSGGMVWAPDRDWAEDVIAEVSAFPRSAHDDYVDSTSMHFTFARKNGVALRKVEYIQEDEERRRFRGESATGWLAALS